MAANSKSARFYRSHPESRHKKQLYDRKLEARPAQVKKRVESNRARVLARKRGKNIRGLDFDHAVGRFVPVATNRGRRGEGGRRRK